MTNAVNLTLWKKTSEMVLHLIYIFNFPNFEAKKHFKNLMQKKRSKKFFNSANFTEIVPKKNPKHAKKEFYV